MSGSSPGRLVLVVAVVCLASVGVAVALTALGGGDTADQPTLSENASTQLRSLDGLTATRVTTITRGNETTRTVERVSLDLESGAVRARQLSGPGEVDLRVSNGSTLWLHDRDDATVTRLDDAGGASTDWLDAVPRLLARLDRPGPATTGSATTPTPGVSPLPVLPAADATAGDAPGPVGAGTGQYTVSLSGTATVDGRRTRVVAVRQTGGGEPVTNYTQRLWLDADRYVPLKRQTSWTQGGQRTVITTTYRNVTFDPGLSASTFRFDPPANVSVERPDTPDQQRFESVAALRAAANMSVPEPTLPESFVLARASRTTGRITSVGLRYVNATSVVEVAKIRPAIPARSEGERVTVAGRNGTYRTLGPKQSVMWTCGDTQYKVQGRGLPRATLLEVAQSVGCG